MDIAIAVQRLRCLPDAAARRPAAWYAGFALYAAGVALFSGRGLDRWWGIWAAGGYAIAAAVAVFGGTHGTHGTHGSCGSRCTHGTHDICGSRRIRCTCRGQAAALAVAVAGALAAPLVWLASREPVTPDALVVARSGVLLLHHGSPYLQSAQLIQGGWLAYNPYLPVMAVFGLPKALGLPGLLADPRPWLAAATFLLLWATFRISGISRIGRIPVTPLGLAALAISSPVMAFPLAEGITDPPVIALTCLALALLIRFGGGWRPAVVLGVVCAMKYTAWPALAVLIVMVAVRDGRRAVARFTATALGTAIALTAALAPAAIVHPAAIVANTVAYPLGLTAARSPAASPLPGHLLAALGPDGNAAAIALLLTAGAALVASLITAPPRTPAAAARRIALGLTALFALSPATRFGYFCYPLALYGWVALAGYGARGRQRGAQSPAEHGPSAELRPLAELDPLAGPSRSAELGPLAGPSRSAELGPLAGPSRSAELGPLAEPDPSDEPSPLAEPDPSAEPSPLAEPSPSARVAHPTGVGVR
jgi:hypothetical protein